MDNLDLYVELFGSLLGLSATHKPTSQYHFCSTLCIIASFRLQLAPLLAVLVDSLM